MGEPVAVPLVIFCNKQRQQIINLARLGLQVAILLAGAVLTESVFAWPGMGRYLVDRIALRDYTAVQSVITMFALFVALASLAVDIIYSLLDPRVKY